MKLTRIQLCGGVLLCTFLIAGTPLLIHGQSALPKPEKDAVLKAADIKPKLFPESVFFRGQTAPTQMRNTAGIHFLDDFYVLAGLVDNSGYSTGIRQKYQAYFITEVALNFGSQTLKPGAYGAGFIDGAKFIVMDLAANDLFTADSHKDADMKRPVPLQITSGGGNAYRLYAGRDYVEFARAK